jgi:hypothetical protein
MVIVHPAIIVVLVIGALFELWIVFAFVYAAMDRESEGSYCRSIGDTPFALADGIAETSPQFM